MHGHKIGVDRAGPAFGDQTHRYHTLTGRRYIFTAEHNGVQTARDRHQNF